MTTQIEIVKNIIEDALWYDGGVYDEYDSTDNMSYIRSGCRLGDYSGQREWLKIVSTYAFNNFTIILNPTDHLEVNAPTDSNEIIIDYIDETTTQAQLATALQAKDYIHSATASNADDPIIDDTSEGILRIGKFRVKRKEAGLPSREVHEIELYNIQCESDGEEAIKIMVNQIRRLTTSTFTQFSYVWSTAGYPFWVRFFGGDDKKNREGVEFIITISGDCRWML